ncbi:MAG: hypothetical protein HFP77_08480 [Methylococcales symbiont of Iophon sp. n. MRB-2018]|nr:MAG: hypothetical protein HFP77_08480 [Methylococcales symbiont of Iophon sp. n. MRB-2018]KAF3979739.1 MAG: hypothetical protein HFP76_05790 [Methylococcales symbiont of Iophon sp. n. MRB-2018]
MKFQISIKNNLDLIEMFKRSIVESKTMKRVMTQKQLIILLIALKPANR